MHNRNQGLRNSSLRAESLQCVREVFLPGEIELFDLSLKQRTNRPGCSRVGAGCILFKSIADKLLKLEKNFLPNGFGRGKNQRHRNDNSTD